MNWSGKLEFGSAWVAFRGRSAENSMHAHAALQLTLASDGVVTLRGAAGAVSGNALLVGPGTPHAIESTGILTLLLIEPQSPAAYILGAAGLRGIVPLAPALAGLVDPDLPLATCMDRLLAQADASAPLLDARLTAALEHLRSDTSAAAVARAAGAAGLSTSRLRALAMQGLGTPLATWVAWRRLERAGLSLAAGASLAQAAHDGGFADQAHFTRTMRKVFGITPKMLGQLAR